MFEIVSRVDDGANQDCGRRKKCQQSGEEVSLPNAVMRRKDGADQQSKQRRPGRDSVPPGRNMDADLLHPHAAKSRNSPNVQSEKNEAAHSSESASPICGMEKVHERRVADTMGLVHNTRGITITDCSAPDASA
jgi:hypothetical protein